MVVDSEPFNSVPHTDMTLQPRTICVMQGSPLMLDRLADLLPLCALHVPCIIQAGRGSMEVAAQRSANNAAGKQHTVACIASFLIQLQRECCLSRSSGQAAINW